MQNRQNMENALGVLCETVWKLGHSQSQSCSASQEALPESVGS